MNAAHEKNLRALEFAAGGGADAGLIGSARVGVWTGGARPLHSGLLAEALGEVLGRFWRRIDAWGPHADRLAAAAGRSSAACGAAPAARRAWDPPYDFAIGAGEPAPPGCAPDGATIGAGGWRVASGSGAPPGGADGGGAANPAGALAAASLAAAEAFKSVFGIGAAERLPVPYEWDAWYGAAPGRGAPAAGERLDLGEVHVFGVGAVSHALLWIVARWPGGVTGTVHLVDPDSYDAGNPHRYIGTSAEDVGLPKASAAAHRLRRACPGIEAIAHDTDMNDYFTRSNPDCMIGTAVCGLDSKEGRRQLGLKLPRTTVNMWTSGFHAGASTFSFDDGWPCIHCAYPPPAGPEPDEASLIHGELGLAHGRARELLDSGRSIGEDDARIISAATGARIRDIRLRPLRALRAEMCATGRVRMRRAEGGDPGDAHVPLAFASAMAGVAGFTELVRAALGARRDPGQFQTSVLKYPSLHSWTRRGPSRHCAFCADPIRLHVRGKYAGLFAPEVVAQ